MFCRPTRCSILEHAQSANGLIAESVTYLLVKLDIGGLELLLNVRTEVVRELVVRVRHALSSLRGAEGTLGRLGDSVQGDGLILRVSDLIKMNM